MLHVITPEKDMFWFWPCQKRRLELNSLKLSTTYCRFILFSQNLNLSKHLHIIYVWVRILINFHIALYNHFLQHLTSSINRVMLNTVYPFSFRNFQCWWITVHWRKEGHRKATSNWRWQQCGQWFCNWQRNYRSQWLHTRYLHWSAFYRMTFK